MPKRPTKKQTGRWRSAIANLEQNLDEAAEEQSPTSSADLAKAKKAKRPRIRSKKLLRPSLIRRICKTPSKRSIEAVASKIAEVMYTNLEFDPSYYSEHGDWSFSSLERNEDVAEVKPQPVRRTRKRTATKKAKTVNKRQKNEEQIRVMQSLLGVEEDEDEDENGFLQDNPSRPKNLRQCLCTEVDGHVYKLMDLPLGLDDEESIRSYLRTMPRIVLKRQHRE